MWFYMEGLIKEVAFEKCKKKYQDCYFSPKNIETKIQLAL